MYCIIGTSLAVAGEVQRSALVTKGIAQRVRGSEVEMQSHYHTR